MIVVQSGRNPFAIYLLAALVLSGLSGLVDPARASEAVVHLLPYWELWLWYGGLTVCSALSLVGIFTRGVNGLLIERVGLCVLSVLILAYVVSVTVAGGIGNLAALVTAALAVASVVRVVQISRDLRRVSQRPVAGGEPGARP